MRKKALAVSHGSLHCVFFRFFDVAHPGIGRSPAGRDSLVECGCVSYRCGPAGLLHDLLHSPSLWAPTGVFPLTAVARLLRRFSAQERRGEALIEAPRLLVMITVLLAANHNRRKRNTAPGPHRVVKRFFVCTQSPSGLAV